MTHAGATSGFGPFTTRCAAFGDGRFRSKANSGRSCAPAPLSAERSLLLYARRLATVFTIGKSGKQLFATASVGNIHETIPLVHYSFALLFSRLFSGHASNPERSHKRGLRQWHGIKQRLLI